MYLTLPEEYRQAFLYALTRHARPPLTVLLNGNTFHIGQISPDTVAQALCLSAFPLYEQQMLSSIIRRRFSFLSSQQQKDVLFYAQRLLAEDIRRNAMASGPGRHGRIARALAEQLQKGNCDFLGFCRFALVGYRSYLNYMLDLAADELLAEEEQQEYLSLLSSIASFGNPHSQILLSFSPKQLFQIWQWDTGGFCPVEGGKLNGREDMLLANILSARPGKLIISGAGYAPPEIFSLLKSIFGERLIEKEAKALDKEPLR